jgi:hypothetical protein
VQVTLLQITSIEFVDPCELLSCPRILVHVHVETSNQDQVTLAVTIESGAGQNPRSYTRNLSGSTSYQVAVPGGGQAPYPKADACPAVRVATVVATASTTPGGPGPVTTSRPCSS